MTLESSPVPYSSVTCIETKEFSKATIIEKRTLSLEYDSKQGGIRQENIGRASTK